MTLATLVLFALVVLAVVSLAWPSTSAGITGSKARAGHIPGTSGTGVYDRGSPYYEGP